MTPPIFLLAFALALLVNLPWRGIGFFRTAYFLPVVIGLGTSSLLWVWLLNDRVGVFNAILLSLGVIDTAVVWLGEFNLALGVHRRLHRVEDRGIHHDPAAYGHAGHPR